MSNNDPARLAKVAAFMMKSFYSHLGCTQVNAVELTENTVIVFYNEGKRLEAKIGRWHKALELTP